MAACQQPCHKRHLHRQCKLLNQNNSNSTNGMAMLTFTSSCNADKHHTPTTSDLTCNDCEAAATTPSTWPLYPSGPSVQALIASTVSTHRLFLVKPSHTFFPSPVKPCKPTQAHPSPTQHVRRPDCKGSRQHRHRCAEIHNCRVNTQLDGATTPLPRLTPSEPARRGEDNDKNDKGDTQTQTMHTKPRQPCWRHSATAG